MEVIKGIPVSPGAVIGPAFILDFIDERVPYRTVAASDVPREMDRLEGAFTTAVHDLEALRDQTSRELGDEAAKIFGFHIGLLGDATLTDPIRNRVKKDRVTAEYAVAEQFRVLADRFRQLGNEQEVFRQKANDVFDLERRLLAVLVGQSADRLQQLSEPVVVIAHELTPSQAASLNREMVLAVVTDAGGRTSHTSIVARALEIPAVVGCQRVTADINEGEKIIVDGDDGVVVLRPHPEQIEEYEEKRRARTSFKLGLESIAALEAVTQDGARIKLLGNIEFPNEVEHVIRNGGDGVGLYRTEFLYLTTRTEPTEEVQFEAYRTCAEQLGGKPLTIRTLDLGADKFTQEQAIEPERNPNLGCRGIRYTLQNLPRFRTQMRAILRASAHGNVKIMFPLIATMMELRQAKLVLHDVMEELEEENIPFNDRMEVGMMIEVPSAAMMAGTFVREVDFISIGTNDLIQYTLAVDRGNERVANLYSGANPAVLQLVKQVIRAGKRFRIETSICGEIAGEITFTMLLIGFGLRTLSLVPPQIPQVKRLIRSVDIPRCERLARRVGSFDSERQVLSYLREQVREVLPEAFGGRTAEPAPKVRRKSGRRRPGRAPEPAPAAPPASEKRTP